MSHLRIASKLMAAGAVALTVVAVGGGVAYRESQALADQLHATAALTDATLTLQEARRASDGAGEALRNLDSAGVETTRVAYETYYEALDERLGRVAASEAGAKVTVPAHRLLTRLRAADEDVRPTLTADADIADTLIAGETFLDLGGEVADLEDTAHAAVRSQMRAAAAGARRPVLVIVLSVVAMVLLGGLALFFTVRVAVIRPIVELTVATGRIVESGDLTQEIVIHSHDEIGELAQRFQAMVHKLRSIPESLGVLVEDLTRIADSVVEAMASLTRAARAVNAQAVESSTRMEATEVSAAEVASHVSALSDKARMTGEANRDLASRNMSVAESVGKVRRAIEETASGIVEVTASAREVSTEVTTLDASMAETSASMIEMDAEIRAVDTHARETKELSGIAAQEAASGGKAMTDALIGIAAMGDSARVAAEVMERLGLRIREVGGIVGDISSIADQTTLLALNASIIASQAGEHGRGFSVVANEVKSLAARTRESSKGIAEIVALIQEESQQAVETVRNGVASAEEGLALGQQAEATLTALQQSAHRASQMTGAIATASAEQSKTSAMVTRAVQDVADTSGRISSSVASQAAGAERLRRVAEQMRGLSDGMLSSTSSQTESSVQISRAIERIGELAESIGTAQHHQADGAAEVRQALETMRRAAGQQEAEVLAVEVALEGLRDRGMDLLTAVRKFRY